MTTGGVKWCRVCIPAILCMLPLCVVFFHDSCETLCPMNSSRRQVVVNMVTTSTRSDRSHAACRHIAAMSQRLQDGITRQLDGVVLNGPPDPAERYVGNLNLSFSYVEGESLIMGLKVRPGARDRISPHACRSIPPCIVGCRSQCRGRCLHAQLLPTV